MRKTFALLLLLLAFTEPAEAAWEARITAFDRDRIERLAGSRAEGLAAAEAAKPAIRTTIHNVVARQAGPISAQALTGVWRCRTMKLGGIASAIVYDWFTCRVRTNKYGLYFEKISGSQHMAGYLEDYGDGRMILLGAMSVKKDHPRPYSGANPGVGVASSSSDIVGLVSSLGPGHARIEFPYSLIESDFDVVELRR